MQFHILRLFLSQKMAPQPLFLMIQQPPLHVSLEDSSDFPKTVKLGDKKENSLSIFYLQSLDNHGKQMHYLITRKYLYLFLIRDFSDIKGRFKLMFISIFLNYICQNKRKHVEQTKFIDILYLPQRKWNLHFDLSCFLGNPAFLCICICNTPL